jgi:arginine:ornithine antiporter/lysine permease
MAAEVLFVAAADEDMPRFLQRKSAADVPTAALLMSTILIQIMLVVAVLSEDAFNFALVILAISVIGAIAGIVASTGRITIRENHARD